MPAVFECCCPQRWITVGLCFLGTFNAYAMQVCLSIAITEMAVPPPQKVEFLDDTCPDDNNTTANTISNMTIINDGKFQWDERTQGLILSAFFWGYFCTSILGGMIADKFGGKHTLGFSILFNAILTLLTPISIQWGGATALIVIRALMGAGAGPVYPSVTVLLTKWIPETERSWAGSWGFSGGTIGTVFGMAVSGVILHHFKSWPPVFYVFGGIGVFSYFLNCLLCYNRPQDNPFISELEIQYLQERLRSTSNESSAIPWRHILRSKPVWALLIVTIGKAWGLFTILSDMPKYLSSVLKFSVKNNGFLSSLSSLCMFTFSSIASWIADKVIERGFLRTVNVRKIGSTLGTVGPGIFLVLGSYAGCSAALAVTFQTIGMALLGCINFGLLVNPMDLAPNFAGTLMGLCFGLATIGGFISPYLVGVLTPHQTLSEWRLVFWIVLIIFASTNLVFMVFGSADVQEWNDPELLKERMKKTKTIPKEQNELPIIKD